MPFVDQFNGMVTILDSNGFFYMEIHATPTELHDSEVTITKYPIESGGRVSDHVIVEPTTLEINGIISDDPLSLTPPTVNTSFGFFDSLKHAVKREFQNSVLGSVSNAVTGLFFKKEQSPLGAAIDNQGANSIEAKQMLDALLATSEPVTVVTGIDVYANMILRKLSIPRDITTSDALKFKATFTSVQFAFSELTDIPAPITNPQNSPLKSQGTKQVQTPQPAVENRAGLVYQAIWGGN